MNPANEIAKEGPVKLMLKQLSKNVAKDKLYLDAHATKIKKILILG